MIRTLYAVTIRDRVTAGQWVPLPGLRTKENVKKLRKLYAEIRTEQVSEEIDAPLILETVDGPVPDQHHKDFSAALGALAALGRRCSHDGNEKLAERTRAAIAALLGRQDYVEITGKIESDPFPARLPESTARVRVEHSTLAGIGPVRRRS